MSKEILSVPGSKSSWVDGERFVGRLLKITSRKSKKKSKKKGGKDTFNVLLFRTAKGEEVERNSNTKWEELLDAKVIKVGDVLEVEAFEEVRTNAGNKFRPFKIVRLSGSDIPKVLRK